MLSPRFSILVLLSGLGYAGANSAFSAEGASSAARRAEERKAASAAMAVLKWDSTSKVYDAKAGERDAVFVFNVTNTSTSLVAIESIQTSCGCTVADLPPLPISPFLLAPRASTSIRVTLDLTGKTGSLTKAVDVKTSLGHVALSVQANIPAVSATHADMTAERALNMALAVADPQAIFKGECAKCHVTPGIGKMGQELYHAVCSICHEANPRASAIPDLAAGPESRDLAYWTKWISEGAAGTMMPSFSAARGGPLTEEQVGSLALYLFAEFSRPRAAPAASSR